MAKFEESKPGLPEEIDLGDSELAAVTGGAHNHQRSDSNTGNPTSGDGSVRLVLNQNSGKIKNITDGTSNTIMVGE